MERTDWDIEVKTWIKDVPYVWIEGKGWKDCRRLYLLEKSMENWNWEVHKDGGKYFNLGGNCSNDVKNFFIIKTSAPDSQSIIRVNGKTIYPYKKSSIEHIYDHIGKVPNLSNKIGEYIIQNRNELFPPIVLPEIEDIQEPTKVDYNSLYSIFWYIKLSKRNSDVCMPISLDIKQIYNIRDIRMVYTIMVHVKSDEQFNNPYIKPSGIPKSTLLCLKRGVKRFVFVVNTHFWWGRPSCHAILLLAIVKNEREVEVYFIDPWGTPEYSESYVLSYPIMKYLGFGNYKILVKKAPESCPIIGPQILESLEESDEFSVSGNCEMWSFWLAELILLNPEKSYPEILRAAVNDMNEKSTNYLSFISNYRRNIRKYSQSILDKHNIEGKSFDSDNIYSLNFEFEKFKNYVALELLRGGG